MQKKEKNKFTSTFLVTIKPDFKKVILALTPQKFNSSFSPLDGVLCSMSGLKSFKYGFRV